MKFNPFWIFLLFIVGVNVLKQIAEKNKQAQGGTQQRKQPPGRLFEAEDETRRPLAVQRPEQQQGQAGTGGPPPVFGTGPRDTVFDQWFEEGQKEDDRVAWEAEREAVAEFLGVKLKPPLVVPPIIPAVQEVKPKPKPVPVRVEPKLQEVQRPTTPAAKVKRRPARKRAARVPADVLPPGIFRDIGDVRRGIIMSEILGPPTGLK